MRRSWSIRCKAFGDEHPNTLAAMTYLASSYREAGRRTEAIELQESALQVIRRLLPTNHVFLIDALTSLALCYETTGRKNEALPLREELARILNARRQLPGVAVPIPEKKSTDTTIKILVPPDSTWKWLHPRDGQDPALVTPGFHQSFFLADFDDSGWREGKDGENAFSGFAYGELNFVGIDLGLPEDPNHRHTAYFRHRFTTDAELPNLELRCRRDDGIIVYLDGREIIRDNVEPGVNAYHLHAVSTINAENEITVHRFSVPGILPPGTHLLAISVHNAGPASSDLRLGGVTLVRVEPSAKID